MADRGERELFGRWRAVGQRPDHSSNMSAVWRVRDASDDASPIRALKIMKWPKSPTSSAYLRFVQEAQALERLAHRHPGIMPLVDRGEIEEDGKRRVFLVMPYYDTNLAKAAKGLAGNPEFALTKCLAVAAALEAAHADSVIHRDVKPHNVLLAGDEQRVVLGDFGICLLDEDERFTHTGNGTLGTPHFVAPELQGGGRIEDVVPTADVYSLGKTLYAVLAGGDVVFPGSRHRDDRYDLLRRFGDPRLAHIHGALDLLTAEDPTQRPQSMAEARALLQRVLEAIRQNVTYREGLYRSGPSAEWRALRFIETLGRVPAGSAARRDVVREALETATMEVESYAGDCRGVHGAVDPVTGSLELASGFLHAVDEILATILPLLKVEDERLEDAQALLVRWIDGDAEESAIAATLQGVACIAMHIVTATAWRWERDATLGWGIEQLSSRYWQLNYLAAFDGLASRSREAVERSLADSSVVTRIAPDIRASVRTLPGGPDREKGEPPSSLLSVGGLVAMRGVWFGRVGEIAAELSRGEKPAVVEWPAFQPEYRAWIEVLPEQLMRSPSWERKVSAQALNVGDVLALRKYWAKNAPVLGRLFAASYRLRHRDASGWRREELSAQWVRWAGTPPRGEQAIRLSHFSR